MGIGDVKIYSQTLGDENALVDPTTTTGDMIYNDSSALQRLPIGTSGQFLGVGQSLIPEWQTSAQLFSGPTFAVAYYGATQAITGTTLMTFDTVQNDLNINGYKWPTNDIVSDSPHGFVNRTSTTMSISGDTFNFGPAAGGTFTVYVQAKQFNFSTGFSVVIPHVTLSEGNWFFYFAPGGSFVSSRTAWDLETDAPIALVYFDSTNNNILDLLEERHGAVMDPSTHSYLHNNVGTLYQSGFPVGFTAPIDTANPTNVEVNSSIYDKVTLDTGVIWDEDLKHTITNATVPTSPFEQLLGVQIGISSLTNFPAGTRTVEFQSAHGLQAGDVISFVQSTGDFRGAFCVSLVNSAVSVNIGATGVLGVNADPQATDSGKRYLNAPFFYLDGYNWRKRPTFTYSSGVVPTGINNKENLFWYPDGATFMSYNLNTGSGWTQAQASVTGGFDRWVATWLVATNSLSLPIIAIQGQREDSSLADAQNNNTLTSLNLENFPSQEFKVLYRLIFRSKASYTNKNFFSYLNDVQDLRKTQVLPTQSFVATDHNSLTGRSTANSHPLTAVGSGSSNSIVYADSVGDLATDTLLTFDSTNKSVAIGSTFPVGTAKLEVTSVSQGFLPPRMTNTQKNSIPTPATALHVWDSTLVADSYYNGTSWKMVSENLYVTSTSSTPYSASINECVLMDSSSAAKTVTLPSPTNNAGKRVVVVKADSSEFIVTVNDNGSELINGQDSAQLISPYEAKTFFCTGSTWIIL